MTYKYTMNQLKENMAKALGSGLPISFKQSIEICNYIRGDDLSKAKAKLQQVMDKDKPVPFKRFTNGVGHRKGNIASGRYPIKACTLILKLIESAEANAVYKGLSLSGLKIAHLSAQQAPAQWHYGRRSRRRMKQTHIEIVVEEIKKPKIGKESIQKTKGQETNSKTGVAETSLKSVKNESEEKQKKPENNVPQQTKQTKEQQTKEPAKSNSEASTENKQAAEQQKIIKSAKQEDKTKSKEDQK